MVLLVIDECDCLQWLLVSEMVLVIGEFMFFCLLFNFEFFLLVGGVLCVELYVWVIQFGQLVWCLYLLWIVQLIIQFFGELCLVCVL